MLGMYAVPSTRAVTLTIHHVAELRGSDMQPGHAITNLTALTLLSLTKFVADRCTLNEQTTKEIPGNRSSAC